MFLIIVSATSLQSQTFYVSHSGSDLWSGTRLMPSPFGNDGPFRTIDKARQAVRTVLAAGCGSLTGPIIVNIVGDSPYYQGTDLGSQLLFQGNTSSYPSTAGQGDNGCSTLKPVIYQGFGANKPVISGGMRATGWTPTGYVGPNFVQYKMPCVSPCTNTEMLLYNGERRFRPQYGAAAFSGVISCTGVSCTWVSGTQFNVTQWPNSVLVINGQAVQIDSVQSTTALKLKTSLGNLTNVSYTSYVLGNIGTRLLQAKNGNCPYAPLDGSGTCSEVSPANPCSLTGFGCNGATNASCHTDTVCDDRFRVGLNIDLTQLAPVNLSGTTTCANNSGANFGTEVIVWEDFTAAEMRICAIDYTNRIIILSGSFKQAGGSVSYGPHDNYGFVMENFATGPTKISQAQQWYLDRTVNPPVFYYNALVTNFVSENPNTDTVEIGVIAQALFLSNANFITFRYLQVSLDNWKVDDAGTVSSDSQPRVPGTVSVANSGNINFEWVDISHTSADGLEFYQCRNNTKDPVWCPNFLAGGTTSLSSFQHGTLTDIGSSGLQIGNRLAKFDTFDTDATVPFQIDIRDNLFKGNGRRIPGGGSLITAVLHDSTFINNDLDDSYHAELAVCGSNCDFGGGHGIYNVQVILNHLRNCAQGVVSDIGCLYFSTGNGTRQAVGTCGAGNKVVMNLVHDDVGTEARPEAQIGSADDGIYLDNMTCNTFVFGNVVWRIGDACQRNTDGIPLFTSGVGASGPNVWQNNICAFSRVGAFRSAAASMWRQLSDFNPSNCPAANVRLQFIRQNEVVYSDRDHNDSPSYYIQAGSPDSCGFPVFSTQQYVANQYYLTLHTDLGSYSKAFHVVLSTPGVPADSPSPAQNTAAQWCFYNINNWKTGTNGKENDGVTLCTTVGTYLPSTGEDTGSVGNVLPPFVSPGYPNDDYHMTCPISIAGFNCTVTNRALDYAGRYTQKTYNPVIVQTFSTAVYDPGHTNNRDY